MKKLGDAAVAAAIVCIIIGVVSRVTMRPIQGVMAGAFLQFAGVCLLLAIALFLREK